MAEAVLWLRTEVSSFVTGHAITADGGRTAQKGLVPQVAGQRERDDTAAHDTFANFTQRHWTSANTGETNYVVLSLPVS